LLELADPPEMGTSLGTYCAAWRLGNILPDDDAVNAGDPIPDVSAQTLTQDILLMVRELEQQVDQLDSEFDLLLAIPDESTARIEDLQRQLERVRRPLGFEYFGAGSVGMRFIESISDPIVAVLLGARETELSPQASELLNNALTGASDLVHRLSGALIGNKDVSERAEEFEKRIATYLAAEQAESNRKQNVIRDSAEPWCPELVAIPPGDLLMGSDDTAHQDEKPAHPVTIKYRFAVGRYPVTFAEYDAFCQITRREKPADNGWGRDLNPAINISWDDAQAYVAWLREQTGRQYRLLTEAEWEYACRAGSTSFYSFGDNESDLVAHAWFVGNLDGRTSPVGKKLPNDFGLFDMHGNVWEWVEDVWHDNYMGTPPGDGRAWVDGGNPRNRVMRGGSWVSGAKGLRSSVRFAGATDYRDSRTGLRVALTLDS
jgi:formylglycine-generating enzyme required for sulfatase activity